MRQPTESFMRNFRWITPLVVSITSIVVTILIFVVSQLIMEIRILRNDLKTEIRNVHDEIYDGRNFSIQYTDKMIEMLKRHN